MGLYERLLGLEEPSIAVHEFMSMMGEFERGMVTGQQASDAFELSPAEDAEVATLLTKIISPLESISFGGFLTLTNIGATYDAIALSQGLGIVRVETAGINIFEFGVRVNKVGSGTQSWQLWNDTDGAQITVIDDAGAAGVKNLSVISTIPPAAAGHKTLRVRAKSTTAADDPVFMGAYLMIKRVGKLTSAELHEVLLLGRQHYPPYATVADVKSRLGV